MEETLADITTAQTILSNVNQQIKHSIELIESIHKKESDSINEGISENYSCFKDSIKTLNSSIEKLDNFAIGLKNRSKMY